MQTAVSRRNVLWAGAATLFVPSTIYAGQKLHASPVATKPAPSQLSSSLMTYVFAEMAQSSSRVMSKSATKTDLMEQSNRMRLIARHFESLNIDSHVKTMASTPEGKSTILARAKALSAANTSDADAGFAQLHSYNSSVKRADVFKSDASDEELSSAADDVASNGITKYFHKLADDIKSYAKTAPQSSAAGLQGASYQEDGAGAAHLLTVDECKAEQKKKAAICFGISTGVTLVTVGTIAAICEGVTAGACTVLIGSFGYFAYATLYAFALALCTLYLASDPETHEQSNLTLQST